QAGMHTMPEALEVCRQKDIRAEYLMAVTFILHRRSTASNPMEAVVCCDTILLAASRTRQVGMHTMPAIRADWSPLFSKELSLMDDSSISHLIPTIQIASCCATIAKARLRTQQAGLHSMRRISAGWLQKAMMESCSMGASSISCLTIRRAAPFMAACCGMIRW